MQYRNDLAAALARVHALERELAELRGEGSAPTRAQHQQGEELARARAELATLRREHAKLESNLRSALQRAEAAHSDQASELDSIKSLQGRIKSLYKALESERAARAKAERAAQSGEPTRASRTVPSRRDAMWRQARLATLAPGALLAASWDTLRDVLANRPGAAEFKHAGSLRTAAGGEPVLVHPRPATMGFAEVRVGPGMGEIMVTTQDAIVEPTRPKRRRR